VHSDAAASRVLEQAIAQTTPKYYSSPVKIETTPVNVEGLAQLYEWVGLDPKEAKKV
jgi:hypothetical protein